MSPLGDYPPMSPHVPGVLASGDRPGVLAGVRPGDSLRTRVMLARAQMLEEIVKGGPPIQLGGRLLALIDAALDDGQSDQ